MRGTLDDEYLEWLYNQVSKVRVRRSSRTYWDLLRQLYSIEYAWLVANDDNRAEDGRELRDEWASGLDYKPDDNWMHLPCSFLEMLIALSRRLSFETDQESSAWFWHLLSNVGLAGFNDRSNFSSEEVEDRVMAVIWRTYDANGHGGLFPLRCPQTDQRGVELWYQMSAYILQNE